VISRFFTGPDTSATKKRTIMKKTSLIIALSLLSLAAFSQQESHQVIVTNITVPVRVFENDTFVDSLNLDDFEILENGEPQEVRAMYLVNKQDIARKEEKVGFFPSVSRHYYLLFQMTEYNPKLAESMEYFFQNVISSEDSLTVQTPVKSYQLSKSVLQNTPREKIAKDLLSIIKKDTKMGGANYNSLLRDMKMLIRGIQSGSGSMSSMDGSGSTDSMFSLEYLLPRYRQALNKMDELRMVDESKFLAFASSVNKLSAEKNVFLFYQREFRPEIKSNILNVMLSTYQDQSNVMADLQDLFQHYSRDLSLDVNRLKQVFSDASINFNFIFMNKEPENVTGVNMREQSEDIFKAFSQVAAATGGMTDNSQNPSAGFKHALKSSESYYLLYYTPRNYLQDGAFKEITVRVKGREYKMAHRSGYFAN
jgi:hypothetical protein